MIPNPNFDNNLKSHSKINNVKVFRSIEIDFLRGLAIFFMILVHTSVYFLVNPFMKFSWNFSEWAVAGFIFCSAYVFFINNKNNFWNEKKKFNFKLYKGYLVKRIKRLIIPYYIFLPFFTVSYFIANKRIFDFKYLFDSVFLIGGVDISWLVLLFLIFAILMPFIKYFFETKKNIFYSLFLISIISSIYFLIDHNLNFNYKFIFWLPWSSVVFYTAIFKNNENNKKNLWFSLFGTITFFIISTAILSSNHFSLNQIDNKYPPNLYHLSFGMLGVLGFYLLSKFGVFNVFNKFLNFLSINSYSIYFIHYLILFASANWFVAHSNWIIFVIFIFITTILVQAGLNKSRLLAG